MPETSKARIPLPGRVVIGALVTSGLMLGGAAYLSGSASAQTTEQQPVPNYEVLDVFEADGVVEVDVSTDVKREERLRSIAEDLRENEANVPESGTLLVEYYDDEDTSENTGFALVFDDEQAVLESGDSEQFGQVYDAEEAERIIEEEDGMRVVSYREFKEENSGIWSTVRRFLL